MAAEKILVVDDSPTAVRLIRSSLANAGFSVITASDGEEALEVAREEMPRLIVLDIILPKQNGYEVCRQLRADEATREVKILLLSSKSHDSDRLWGQKQGADGYLTKPFVENELIDRIKELLENKQYERSV